MFTPHLSIGTRGQGSVVVAADVEALEGGIAELKPGPRTRVVQDGNCAGGEALGHLAVTLDTALTVAEKLGLGRDAGCVADDLEHFGVLVGLVDHLEEPLR